MHIFQEEPKNWQELELLVQQLFKKLECHTEIRKNMTTARGKVVVDIFVKDFVSSPPLIYLCECKYWIKRIPKSVIHSFRTVVHDTGANRGYIISKAGFQRGAFEAADNSNIELVTWEQLQEIFKDRWLNTMKDRITLMANQIEENISGELIGFKRMTQEERNAFLLNILFKSACITNALTYIDNGKIKDFPWKFTDPRSTSNDKKLVFITSLRDYFDLLMPELEDILSDISQLA